MLTSLRDSDARPVDERRWVQLAATATDGSATVILDGVPVPARCLDGAALVVGSAVLVDRVDGLLTVVGQVRTSNPTTVPVDLEVALPYAVSATPAVANPLVVTMADAASWRDSLGWATTDVRQGAYSQAYAQFGYYRGVWLPGSGKYAALRGRRCTGFRVRIHRSSGIGAGSMRLWLAMHAHATRPSSSPVWVTDAVATSYLADGSVTTVALSAAWGQMLLDGTAGGVGLLYSGLTDYSAAVSLASDSRSGEIELDWA